MKKENTTKFYIIYKYDKNTNDIINVYDFDKLKDASSYLNIDYTNINKYIIKSIDNIDEEIKKVKLKEDKFFIYKEEV